MINQRAGGHTAGKEFKHLSRKDSTTPALRLTRNASIVHRDRHAEFFCDSSCILARSKQIEQLSLRPGRMIFLVHLCGFGSCCEGGAKARPHAESSTPVIPPSTLPASWSCRSRVFSLSNFEHHCRCSGYRAALRGTRVSVCIETEATLRAARRSATLAVVAPLRQEPVCGSPPTRLYFLFGLPIFSLVRSAVLKNA